MPPVSPQSSRTAIISWAVVFAILWVIASVLAIIFYANASKATEQYETARKTIIPSIVADTDLNSEEVRQLKDAAGQEGSNIPSGTPALRVALIQRDNYGQIIAGAGGQNPTVAAKNALQTAAAVGKAAHLTIPTNDNLALAVTTLANGLKSSQSEISDLQNQLKQAKTQMAQEAQQFGQQRQQMAKDMEGVRSAESKARAQLATYEENKDQSVGQIQSNMNNQLQQAQQAINQANVQIQQLQRTNQSQAKQIDTLQTKLGSHRINTENPIVQHPDGHIIRIPGKDVVYIDLGSGESVTPGLTFEVYDKVDGIPPAGDPSNDDNLPKGKASIEVTRVGQGSSECRVIRTTPGTQITEGDLIANLVYDPNVKYNFMVYGDFDMDNNGVATPQDADVIKRLVTQWGGKLTSQVNVDTDFVVLGKEPTLPNFTKDELQDPFNAKKLNDATEALNAYQNVKKTAEQLHIPILNQNRFLYLTGYYSQATR
jgi:hypothetical protein